MSNARDNPDPFEAELRSFAPTGPSRAMIDSIGRELAAGGARPGRNWFWFVVPAAAVAACLLVAAATWRLTHPDNIGPPVVSIATHPTTAGPEASDDGDDDRPSLATYRRALARSPAAVDELLDRHAARVLRGDASRDAAAAHVGLLDDLDSLR